MLYKCDEKKKNQVFPGCFIEKKSFKKLLDELQNQGKEIQVLDSKGRGIREFDSSQLESCVFVIGDHEGLPRKEVKPYNKLSIGKPTYFASQTMIIINNELDLREE
jgi:tRNA pseudouridine-54 N-methylase